MLALPHASDHEDLGGLGLRDGCLGDAALGRPCPAGPADPGSPSPGPEAGKDGAGGVALWGWGAGEETQERPGQQSRKTG